MIKVAVFSDIHANWNAFESIIQNVKFKECDLKIFCGDALGYYYDAEKVVSFLRDNAHSAILGNHDRMFKTYYINQTETKTKYEIKYGCGLKIASETLSENNITWLKSLKENEKMKIGEISLLICHGSPWDPDLYVYSNSNEKIFERLIGYPYDIILIGHSHYQFLIEKKGKYILNPGSVGQARKKGGIAEWAVIEIDKLSINTHLYQTPYNVNNLVSQVEKIDPNIPYLKNVLIR